MEKRLLYQSSLKIKVATALMITLTIIMALTPIGMIRLPMVTITIAHIPILITTILLGLYPGLLVALSFGMMSLILAITTPTSILSPFFANPLISILPRLLIPVTTYFVYQFAKVLFSSFRAKDTLSIALSVIIGNFTNTFGVYTMLYLVYAQDIFEKTGKPALSVIITLISTTTLLKCIFIVVLLVPLIRILKKSLRY